MVSSYYAKESGRLFFISFPFLKTKKQFTGVTPLALKVTPSFVAPFFVSHKLKLPLKFLWSVNGELKTI